MAILAKTNFPSVNRKLLTRLFSKIRISTERSYNGEPCWEWTGYVCPVTGYANISHFENPKKFTFLAHRLFYHLFVEPLPAHLIIDHLCRTKHCVNPVHLEAATHKINTSRGVWIKKGGTSFKSHCKNGHLMSGDNLSFHKHSVNDGTRGGLVGIRRICKQCHREKEAKRQSRLRLARNI